MMGASDQTAAQPGPDDWRQATVMVVRDRSFVGWHLLREKEMVEVVRKHNLVAAIRESSGRPDLAPLRLAARADGTVATADADGQVQPGPEFPEVISALAKEWNTIILVDDRIAIGPQGHPIEEVPASVLRAAPNTRHVYAWPDKDLMVARSVAAKLGVGYTTYEHDREGWLVLASDFVPENFLTHPLERLGARHPFVRMSRSDEERSVTYVGAKGDDTLHLHLEWAPPLTKVVPARTRGDSEVAGLARWLVTAPDEVELEPHPAMSETQRRDLQSALSSGDGATFLATVARALDAPPEVATLAEAPPESPDPIPVGERIEPSGRFGAVSQMLGDIPVEEPTGKTPWAAYERWVIHHPGPALVLGVVELVVAIALLVSLFFDVIDGMPWWLRVPIALGLLWDGFGNVVTAAAARAAAGRSDADTPSGG